MVRKIRKQIVALVLFIILLFTITNVSQAVDYGATMNFAASNNTLKVGDTFSLTLSLASVTNVEGVATVHAKIEFDNQILRLDSCEALNSWSAPSYNEANQEFVTERSDVMAPTGEIIKFNFTVLAEPENNSTTISVTNFDVADTNNQINVPDVTATLTVNPSSTEDPDQNPDDNPDQNPDQNPDDNPDQNPGDDQDDPTDRPVGPDINTGDDDKDTPVTGNNSGKDDTVAVDKIPQTGVSIVLPLAIVLGIVVAIAIYARNKKIKDVK